MQTLPDIPGHLLRMRAPPPVNRIFPYCETNSKSVINSSSCTSMSSASSEGDNDHGDGQNEHSEHVAYDNTRVLNEQGERREEQPQQSERGLFIYTFSLSRLFFFSLLQQSKECTKF